MIDFAVLWFGWDFGGCCCMFVNIRRLENIKKRVEFSLLLTSFALTFFDEVCVDRALIFIICLFISSSCVHFGIKR